MTKTFTVYCVRYDSKPKAYIGIADNDISWKIVPHRYFDINNSFLWQKYASVDLIPEIKKICQDTGKTAILNSSHSNSFIQEIAKTVLGYSVIWKDYNYQEWSDALDGIAEYGSTHKSIIEIDHPIDLNDKELIVMIREGSQIIEQRMAEFDKICKSVSKR